ncbi:ATP-dependent 3'-5' DNA helicase [Pichia californica]|uniref:DNA 3'-5' helicase n=1 Tax=Pichia californica TaxID=460514 RepID=A0A9P7BIA6_9ASCO|nr:ATP-dependent 3'-5' DNA helicase [[Candida] californica]KAG0691309.1 ATP-dependent 3'-5' DNA helicase [[Candida] californica]
MENQNTEEDLSNFKEVDIICTEPQKNAITADSKPNSLINIISGPGTGKTTTLCNRVAYLISTGMKPNDILVFSLTNQSVKDFKKTLCKILDENLANEINVTTIHSFANKIVKTNSLYWEIIRDKKTIDSKILNSILQELSLNPVNSDTSKNQTLQTKLTTNEINKIKINNPGLYKKYLNYEELGLSSLLKHTNVVYDKLIYEATQFLIMNTEETIPSFITNYKEIIVDEFQDISAVLLDFILELSKNKQLTIAGDIDQSLYVFNGATPDSNIKKIIPHYEQQGYNLTEIVLDETFRFSKNIHKFSLNLLGTEYSLIEKTVDEEPINVVREQFENNIDEFEFVCNEISYLINNSNGIIKPKNFAVLSIRNDVLDDFKQYFENKNSEIKIKRIMGTQKWLETKISTLVTLMKILDDPHDDPSLFVAISLLDRVGHKLTMKIKQESEESGQSIFDYLMESKKFNKIIDPEIFVKINNLTNTIDRSDPGSIIVALTEISKIFNFTKQLKTKDSHIQFDSFLKNLYESFKLLKTTHPEETDLISYFLSNYQSDFLLNDSFLDESLNYSDGYVTAMTIHGSKGLEWDIVFVLSTVSFENNIVPISINARTNYVAGTRAKYLLYFNKYASDKTMFIDTTNSIDIKNNLFKTYYEKTMIDYIPKLKEIALPNDLKKLPIYSKPMGITKNDAHMKSLLFNISKRKNDNDLIKPTVIINGIKKLYRKV